MKEKDRLINYTIEEFSFLKMYFNKKGPIIKRGKVSTDIYYLGEYVGIQIELDWYDFNVFVLVVRLDNGDIPGGYYVFDGATVRIHIENVLHKTLGDSMVRTRNRYSFESMKNNIDYYVSILSRNAKVINDNDVGMELFT